MPDTAVAATFYNPSKKWCTFNLTFSGVTYDLCPLEDKQASAVRLSWVCAVSRHCGPFMALRE